MATGGASGKPIIAFMSPVPLGTPAAPTILTGAPATAGPGKGSLNTNKILAALSQQNNLIKLIFLYCTLIVKLKKNL